MKKIILSIFFIFCFVGCALAQQDHKVIIKGTFTGATKAHNHDKVFMYTHMSSDSSTIKDGHFSFGLPFKKPMVKFFYIKHAKKTNMGYVPFPLFIDGPGTITIKGDIKKGFKDVEVSGSPATALYIRYGKKKDLAYKKINKALEDQYGAAWLKSDNPKYKALQRSRDSLSNVYISPLIKELVKENPDNYASVFVMASSGRNLLSVNEQKTLYDMFSDDMKQTEDGQNIYAHIQGVKNSKAGTTVADFKLPGPDGNPVDFSRFKGNYVMIDFWASWCVPCRQSFPRMRQVYQQFKEHGFEIYSISIDEDKQAWLKAVHEEQNPWPQSLDTKNIAASRFAVTAVPTTYLISPDDKIIMKEIGFNSKGGGAIEKKLEKLFGEKVADNHGKPAKEKQKSALIGSH